MQTTLVLLKPGAIQRLLVGRLLTRFEDKGLRIAAIKMVRPSTDMIRQHYAEHAGKPFVGDLCTFMTSAPVISVALQGLDAILVVRRMVGPTKGTEAPPGTIRGDFAQFKTFNLVHASDSPEAAARELNLWFKGDAMHCYSRPSDHLIFGNDE